MKKDVPFIHRLEVALYWLWGKENLKGYLFESCNICGSIHFDISNKSDCDNVYKAQYTCRKCGAVADVTEIWRKKGARNDESF